jgi:hypothetical protein
MAALGGGGVVTCITTHKVGLLYVHVRYIVCFCFLDQLFPHGRSLYEHIFSADSGQDGRLVREEWNLRGCIMATQTNLVNVLGTQAGRLFHVNDEPVRPDPDTFFFPLPVLTTMRKSL